MCSCKHVFTFICMLFVVGTVQFIFCNEFFGGVGCSCVVLHVCAARECVVV